MHSAHQNFEDYENQCLHKLMSVQPEFRKLYDIDSYENWFYDHDIGAFHFKADDGRNLYFKYTEVGSFSTKSNTWNWAWDNKYTPKHISSKLQKVVAFGDENQFELLTKGLFDGDEYTGWAMTAIAANLLSAIGAYRVPQEHLFIYFIFTNQLTQDEYDELKSKYIKCDEHISDKVAFVCQHLINGEKQGFNEAFDTAHNLEDDDEYQAWCNTCEEVRVQHGEWTDEAMAFANIKLVCNQCYFKIKDKNMLD